jgi:lantibiotic biosynthesis protein
VLVSALRAPTTIPDRVGHLLAVMEQSGTGELSAISEFALVVRAVRELASSLTSERDASVRRRTHQDARSLMDAVLPGATPRLDVDLRLNGNVTVPIVVAEVLETATDLLARVAACPLGTPAWRAYGERFAERYGEGALVGIIELTDPIRGLGYPSGYLDIEAGPRLSIRDRTLLDLAGQAAQDGVTHVDLSDALLRSLDETALRDRRWTPHLEITAQVLAASTAHLNRGDFRVRIESVSRAVGTMTGRFLPLLDAHEQRRLATMYADLPMVQADAVGAQLSFGVAKPAADALARTVRIMPRVISIGEFPPAGEGVIPLSDLAVGMQDGQLFLAQVSTGRRIEAHAPTALNFRLGVFMTPIARFLAEVSRSSRTQVTGFEWGIAGWLPFTPELRAGRIILAPARWRLKRDELPARSASFDEWAQRLHKWRVRRKAPLRVLLTEGDQHLLLDLEQDAHLDVLRAEIDKAGAATLADAPPIDGFGWIDGRAHSLVVPMALQVTARRPQ